MLAKLIARMRPRFDGKQTLQIGIRSKGHAPRNFSLDTVPVQFHWDCPHFLRNGRQFTIAQRVQANSVSTRKAAFMHATLLCAGAMEVAITACVKAKGLHRIDARLGFRALSHLRGVQRSFEALGETALRPRRWPFSRIIKHYTRKEYLHHLAGCDSVSCGIGSSSNCHRFDTLDHVGLGPIQ